MKPIEYIRHFPSTMWDEGPLLEPSFTFANFVVGGRSNYFANAVARDTAENPGEKFNPVIFYGVTNGLGATHLMNAIGHEIAKNMAEPKIFYASAEELGRQFVAAIECNMLDRFKKKPKESTLLLIDDIHYIEDKPHTKKEFFEVIQALHDRRTQIVMTADRSLRDMPNLDKNVVSKCSEPLIADIQPMDTATKTSIIENKAVIAGICLAEDVVSYIASRADNGSEIDRCIKEIIKYRKLSVSEQDKSVVDRLFGSNKK